MNRWLWIGAATFVVGCVGGYVFHHMTDTVAERIPLAPPNFARNHDSDAETSDAIEPLIVEGALVGGSRRMPSGDAQPMPRVTMTVGTWLPPRFDCEPGTVLRMPYADEDEDWLGLTIDPVLRILESTLPRLNLFDPAEEAENRAVKPQTPEPEPMPAPDYHQQYPHCPYHGGCPYSGR